MNLPSELISQFVKITNDKPETKKETTVYGTTVEHEGITYVKLDGSELLTPVTSTASTQPGERVTVMIKNHSATITGNISSPAARTEDLQNVATDTSDNAKKITEFEIALGTKAEVEELKAETARIDSLTAEYVTIKQNLATANAEIDTLQANEVTINQTLNANKANIETLQTTKLDAKIAEAKYATIESLEATNADINNLEATYGDFVVLSTDKFEAIEAEIAKLEAGEITVEQLKATFATIVQLDAEKARITDLEAEVADIDTLIFGSATGSTIQTSFANAVIAQLGNAQIKSAMIESIAASKITSGDIITNNVRVKSQNGLLLISDETIQISDNTRVRVQIGKDASSDYSINIWDADGNLMFSKGGITDSAIKDAIIRNDMVSDTANIAAHKLDIDSLFEEINGSSNTIKSTQIYLDDQKQTLDVAFKEVTTDVSELQNSISSQGTEIDVIQGQISSKIWQQDIASATNEIGEVTDNLSTQYNTLKQTVDGNSSTIASHTSQIAKKADSTTVTTVSDKVTSLESNLSGFKTTVSNTYATKTQLTDLEVGGRNLALTTSDEWSEWFTPLADKFNHTFNAGYAVLSDNKEAGDEYTIAIELEFADVAVSTAGSFLFRTQGAVDGVWTMTNIWDNGLVNLTSPPADGVYRYSAVRYLNVSAVDATRFQLGFRADYWDGVGKFRYRKIKVEKGNKATDWTPAPEDMATAADITSLTSRLSTAETAISQNETEIATRATKTEVTEAVNKIAIGGRNLIRDSKLDKDTDLWSYDFNHQTVSFDNGYLEVSRAEDASYTSRTFNNQTSSSNPSLLPDEISGKTYVLSADLKAIDGVPLNNGGSLFWRVYYDNSTNFEELTLKIPTDLSSTEWRRCYSVGTFNTRNYTRAEVDIALPNADNGICVRNIMLERATKPSMWSPAPEDMATGEDLSAIETRVASAETKVIQNANSITQIASRTSANESSITSLEIAADGLTTRIDTAESDIGTAQSTADAARATANAAKKQRYHETSGTVATPGYVGIATLTITGSYQNRPITFTLNNRGQQSSTVSWCFSSVNNNDPGLQHLQCDGGMKVWAYKSDTSTWILIVQKSESYDTIYVNDFTNTNAYVTVTWSSIHYNALPTDNITEFTRLAGKLTKETVDNAAKTATNYLNFSTAGLVVGDHTAGTLGKNVLIDSDSVDIRNGSTTLASFGADTIYLGKNSETAVINLCNGSATMRSVDDKDFKIYTDKRLVMAAYSSALVDCWRDSTHMTRISMQSADPDASYMWGGISFTIYQDTIENTFDMSGNTVEFKITDGTNESQICLDDSIFKTYISDKIRLNAVNGIQVAEADTYSAKITLGNNFLQDKAINGYWSDNAVHDIIGNYNGQATYFGPGDIGEATTSYVRGKYVRLYAHTGGGVYLGASGSTAITSDVNMKTDIFDIDGKYMEFFDRLRPITYKYTDGHRDHVGFIAQEVEEALTASGLTTEQFAGLVIERDVVLNPDYDSSLSDEEKAAGETHYDTLYSLRYEEFISLLVKKVQSLQEQIDQLRTDSQ